MSTTSLFGPSSLYLCESTSRFASIVGKRTLNIRLSFSQVLLSLRYFCSTLHFGNTLQHTHWTNVESTDRRSASPHYPSFVLI